MSQQPRGVAQISQIASAFGTGRKMILQRARLFLVKRVERRQFQQFLVFLMFHQTQLRTLSRKISRSLIIPARIRVLTVPSGSPRRAAISAWVRPSK